MSTTNGSQLTRFLLTIAALSVGIGLALVGRLLVLNDDLYPTFGTLRLALALLVGGVALGGLILRFSRRAPRVPPAA
jgi:hypothetical protein